MNHFLLCGSHPLLSLAEAAVLLPGPIPTVVESIALFDRSPWDGAQLQKRLSGAVKIGDIMTSAPLSSFTATHLADLIDALPRGNKVIFGLSLFGAPKEKNQLKQLPIQLKRVLQERKRSVRWFTGDKGTVSSAAVAKLDLIQTGYDLQVIIDAGQVYVGLTTHVQDLDAWSLRDFGRPFRDATMGMLPPKLARLMVNLAGATVEGRILLDPFCGSGTVLMEAALVGYSKQIGSDIDARQIGGSKQNIDWLVSEHFMTTEQRQAITLHTHPVETLPTMIHEQIEVIVTEGFLGKPLNGNETVHWLNRQKQELETLWDYSFQTFAALQPVNGVVVATVPRHRVQDNEITIDADKAATKHRYTRVNPLEIA
jgi:tRNA (guanine10-N2)-dimethyltransferase